MYSEDWFTGNISRLSLFAQEFAQREVNILEIGSFEGRSSNWFVENYCNHNLSKLTCVDTFGGSWEHTNDQTSGLYERFLDNVKNNLDKIEVFKGPSEFILPKLLEESRSFDFIYVDGNHTFDAVMLDSLYSNRLLKKNGIIVFDDYLWNLNHHKKDIPHYAINAFFTIYSDFYDILDSGYQITARKK
jgi:predicted O-methyltransferase YrrM